ANLRTSVRTPSHRNDLRDRLRGCEDDEARLRNSIALRGRLQQLLDRANNVEEALAIEKELARIQAEIESMRARLDRMKSEVELATLSLTLERKRVLGPLSVTLAMGCSGPSPSSFLFDRGRWRAA